MKSLLSNATYKHSTMRYFLTVLFKKAPNSKEEILS